MPRRFAAPPTRRDWPGRWGNVPHAGHIRWRPPTQWGIDWSPGRGRERWCWRFDSPRWSNRPVINNHRLRVIEYCASTNRDWFLWGYAWHGHKYTQKDQRKLDVITFPPLFGVTRRRNLLAEKEKNYRSNNAVFTAGEFVGPTFALVGFEILLLRCPFIVCLLQSNEYFIARPNVRMKTVWHKCFLSKFSHIAMTIAFANSDFLNTQKELNTKTFD